MTKAPPMDNEASVEGWNRFYRNGAGDRSKMKISQAAQAKRYTVSVPRAQQADESSTPTKKAKRK